MLKLGTLMGKPFMGIQLIKISTYNPFPKLINALVWWRLKTRIKQVRFLGIRILLVTAKKSE